MRSGTCPKCGSTAVHTMFNGIYRGQNPGIRIRGLMSTTAEADDYVCTDCGYFEQYFVPGPALQKIARKWPLASALVGDEAFPPAGSVTPPEDARPTQDGSGPWES